MNKFYKAIKKDRNKLRERAAGGGAAPEEEAAAAEGPAEENPTGWEKLLKQAQADPNRYDLAASWINRRMLDVAQNTQRIREGSVARIDRCEKILEQVS